MAFFCRRFAPYQAGIGARFERNPGGEAYVLTDDSHVVPMTLLAQVAVSVMLAAVLWVWLGRIVGTSALLGGAVAVVPNAFLAARLLKPQRDPSARAVLRAAWLGEIGKWLLTGLLFGVVFAVVRPLSAPAVFGGFMCAQLVIPGALLLGGRSGRVRDS